MEIEEKKSDSIQTFLQASDRINSRTVSLTRFQILTLLAFFKGGLQYRELKAALKISDGKLISNLNVLGVLKYIEKFKAQIDNKKLDVYVLTNNGKKELEKMTAWMGFIQKVMQCIGDNNW